MNPYTNGRCLYIDAGNKEDCFVSGERDKQYEQQTDCTRDGSCQKQKSTQKCL